MSGERLTAAGLVMVGIVSVQLGAALATSLFDDLGPGGTVLLRTLFAAVVLLVIWRPTWAVLRGATLRDVLLFGLILAAMNLFFFLALDRLSLGVTVALEFVGPLAVAIAASRRLLDLLWVALAAAGILLLAGDIGDGLDGLGVLFALAAGACWGTYILVSSRVGRGAAGIGGLSVAMAFAALLLIPVGISDGGTALLEPRLLALGLAVGVLGSTIPYAAELEALRRLPAGTFGVLLSVEPAFAALVGFVALGQGLTLTEVAAIALVMTASAGALGTPPVVATPQT